MGSNFLDIFTETKLFQTLLPVITSVEPAGASIYQAAHYGQLVNSGKLTFNNSTFKVALLISSLVYVNVVARTN